MNTELIIVTIVTTIVLVLALLVILGLGDKFISGYNRASPEQKKHYNLPRLRVFTGILAIIMVAVIWISILFEWSEMTVLFVVCGLVAIMGVVHLLFIKK